MQIFYSNRCSRYPTWTECIIDVQGSLDRGCNHSEKKTVVTSGGNGGARIWLSSCEYSPLRNPLNEGFNNPFSFSFQIIPNFRRKQGYDFFRHRTVFIGFIIDEGYILKPGFVHKHADKSSSNGFARRQVKSISFYVKKGEGRSRKCWRGLKDLSNYQTHPGVNLIYGKVPSRTFGNS